MQWVGNTSTWPAAGSITAATDLWVDYETWPPGSATASKIVYTTNGGTTWQEQAGAKNDTAGNNDKWHANLGKFAPGTTVRFAVQAEDAGGLARWDNNGGEDYTARCRWEPWRRVDRGT